MSFLRAKPSRKACASNDWCLPSPAMNKPPGNFLWSSKKESAKKYALGHADLNIFAVGLTQVRFLSMVRAVTVNWGSTSKSLDTAIIALSISRNNNNTALPQQPTATTSAAPRLPPLARYNLLPAPLLQSLLLLRLCLLLLRLLRHLLTGNRLPGCSCNFPSKMT